MQLSEKDKINVTFLVNGEEVNLPCLVLINQGSLKNGLMNVRQIKRNVGLFFVMEKSDLHKFHMLKTFIPLDCLFISQDGIVTEIFHGKPHDKEPFGGNIPSKYVIETLDGFVERNQIRKGIRIKISKI